MEQEYSSDKPAYRPNGGHSPFAHFARPEISKIEVKEPHGERETMTGTFPVNSSHSDVLLISSQSRQNRVGSKRGGSKTPPKGTTITKLMKFLQKITGSSMKNLANSSECTLNQGPSCSKLTASTLQSSISGPDSTKELKAPWTGETYFTVKPKEFDPLEDSDYEPEGDDELADDSGPSDHGEDKYSNVPAMPAQKIDPASKAPKFGPVSKPGIFLG